MKTQIKLFLLFTLISVSSCTNDDEINNYSNANVTVLREGNKCGVPNNNGGLDYLIEFNENYNDLPIDNVRIYYASNLPIEYQIEGLEITISYREPNPDNENELMYCVAIVGGDEFHQLWIINAE